jgi:hypothetical protein
MRERNVMLCECGSVMISKLSVCRHRKMNHVLHSIGLEGKFMKDSRGCVIVKDVKI